MNTGGYEGMSENDRLNQMQELERQWVKRQRWNGIIRTYRAEDVIQLRGSVQINYTLAELGAKRLWHLLQTESCVTALGALTGNLNAFELMKAMIEAGAAAVHFEDQLASAKKCGHMGGKVLVPTQEFIQKLIAARLAADIMGVPTIIMARTDANAASLLTSDIDTRDHSFLTGGRTVEGFYEVKAGLDQAIARGLAYAPYADMIWCETSEPNLEE